MSKSRWTHSSTILQCFWRMGDRICDLPGDVLDRIALAVAVAPSRPVWVDEAQRYMDSRTPDGPAFDPERDLTAGEREALHWYGCGFDTRQIGEQTGVSAAEVEDRLDAALRKLGTATAEDGVAAALDAGLIPIEVTHAV